jgi:membrane-associated protein
MQPLLDFILHIDHHLQSFAQAHQQAVYLLLMAIVFCETGLVITPFLPGDSLLFAVGALSAQGWMDLRWAMLALITAAILGDNLNYWIGRKSGLWMVGKPWFKRAYLTRTEAFFVQHGGRAIVIARFVPIVRTFAPFTAGFGRMDYSRFLAFSVGGGIFWVLSICGLGYALGNLPWIRSNFKLVSLMIIAVSLLPVILEALKQRRQPPPQA